MIKSLSTFILLLAFMTQANAQAPLELMLDDTTYFYRWNEGVQHEFTPDGQENLQTWTDMLTINVFPTVTNGDQLAQIANNLLSLY